MVPGHIDEPPVLPGLGTPYNTPITIRYDEGAEVGYRWFAKKHEKPLYAFGHGLTYTSFEYRNLKVDDGETLKASFTVTTPVSARVRTRPSCTSPTRPGRNACGCSASSGSSCVPVNHTA